MTDVVMFTHPQIVTNASCCSDPRTMCPRCAAAALAGGRGKAPARRLPAANRRDDDALEVLDLGGQPRSAALTVNYGDPDVLPDEAAITRAVGERLARAEAEQARYKEVAARPRPGAGRACGDFDLSANVDADGLDVLPLR